MSEQIVRYVLCIIPILVGAWYVRETARGFKEGKYYGAGVSLMMAIWMICLFVKTFFNL